MKDPGYCTRVAGNVAQKRILGQGNDRTRSYAEKQRIVRELAFEICRKTCLKHHRLTIIKIWSDMKRRHSRFIKRIQDEKCPEVPIPSIRRRQSTEAVEVVEVEEEEEARPSQPIEPPPPDVGEVKEVEVESAGPSSTSPSQDSEEEDAITSPIQEVLKTMKAKLAKMQKEHRQDMRAIQERMKVMEERHLQAMKGTSDLIGAQEQASHEKSLSRVQTPSSHRVCLPGVSKGRGTDPSK
ncbi:uncharacterized protein LOC122925870 [Bufo gargarizans]|uniref:uncharacterized protein LOC122925870 n=1 Tax=Bufo gargarizans TaxID=30331 RepID=UPI001CF41CF3|nr:uncharacterized protein LOC122925870 [Bufo gargarizans]